MKTFNLILLITLTIIILLFCSTQEDNQDEYPNISVEKQTANNNSVDKKLEFKKHVLVYYNIQNKRVAALAKKINILQQAITNTKNKATLDELTDEVMGELDQRIERLLKEFYASKSLLRKEYPKIENEIKKIEEMKLLFEKNSRKWNYKKSQIKKELAKMDHQKLYE